MSLKVQMSKRNSFVANFAMIFGVIVFIEKPAFASKNMLSIEEAKEFCLSVWFPRLRIGHLAQKEEVSQYVNKLLELYTDDVEIVDPNAQDLVAADLIRGKVQVKQYYEAVLGNYPVWNIKILAIYPTAQGFILRYEGLNAGPVKRFEGVDILELTKIKGNWKIKRIMEYYDRVPFIETAKP